MTDPRTPSEGLGPSPRPDDDAREATIADALAHFDDLVVNGALTADPSLTSERTPPEDELAGRRAARRQRVAPQRWLAAAAVVLILGVGGAIVAQFVGSSGEAPTSEASSQASADQDQSGQDEAKAGQAEAGSPAIADAPADAEATPEFGQSLPKWLCEWARRLGVDVCAS